MYTGELISLAVAFSWTACAMFAEVASKRMGSLPFNVLRMLFSLLMLAAMMWYTTGVPYPVGTNTEVWIWMSLSGLVGYVLGDYCLFNSYILIGSRFGQLLMTLSAPAAAIAGWLIIGETMGILALAGMLITVTGISLSIFGKKQTNDNTTPASLPLKGILFGIGAGLGQGIGLVLSAKGIKCYEEQLTLSGITSEGIIFLIPFAATAMRAVTGLIGFSLWTTAIGQMSRLRHAVTDRKAMLAAIGATITGPFIGVSLSLMATQYTATGIAQTIMATTPVLILLPSYLFFKQHITIRETIGAVIAVAGVTLFFV